LLDRADVIGPRGSLPAISECRTAEPVQTLADAATPYVAEFAGRQVSRTVGVPLLVHRGCANPMFGISNAVAYEHLVMHSMPTRISPIRELIGPFRWFDEPRPAR
jgi:hypothetical protein